MSVVPRPSDLDLFLQTIESDEEGSPWMVTADLQVRGVGLLKPILLLHAERHGLPWYVPFTPERKGRPPLLGWRRAPNGAFREWSPDSNGVLWSAARGGLGVAVVGGLGRRATGADGRWLPTPVEWALAERRRADAEAVARRAAEVEVARLREQLRGEAPA